MQSVNLDTWDRKEHFLFFRRSDYPHYNIGADLDISRFKEGATARGLPFSFALTFVVTAAMNRIEAFRYRIHGGEVVLHELIHPSFAYLAPGKPYFKMVTAELGSSVEEFAKRAKEKALAQGEYFPYGEEQGRDDWVFISSIPKVSFTHLTHTISFNKDDAVPRLSWGKYYEREGKLWLPFNVQVHHGFVDGDHVGQYFEALQRDLDALG